MRGWLHFKNLKAIWNHGLLRSDSNFAFVSFGSATLRVTPSIGIWVALPPMAAAPVRHSLFLFLFMFPLHESPSLDDPVL
jgi:hypothetical protein